MSEVTLAVQVALVIVNGVLAPLLVLAGRTVPRPAHTVDAVAGSRTDVPGKIRALPHQ